MTNHEILDMCRKLAGRYKNSQEYDDLVSTGVVKCLELRAQGVERPSTLYYRAREAMLDYMKVGMSPISYPKGRHGRDAVKSDTHHFIVVDDEEEGLEIESDEDVFGSYELKNILQVLGEHLNDSEKLMLMALWRNNNNMKVTAEELGKSKQAVAQFMSRIRKKLVTICDVD
jgi:RNA polymerase sigma factor (sigma-70 family)